MKQSEKKSLRSLLNRLVAIRDEFETLKTIHEEWMDERNYDTDGRFEYTPTGERAQEDYDNLEEWFDTLDNLTTDIEDYIN